ncbi:endonuclease VIII [Pseudobacteriovorax antillogorgiicola]|uniref:DNA-(apurinic or apyrimidinic site) lyase n=1 Tax=Pseudobacteriovorax antillogorgiicola TaxID=1513793 RepID=A0A1Y6CAI0_9BACT|nr:endonuclease VIII [Pseudobacteriovorax antillogorgiicola]TCS49808.1 endonuclease-8 [Pseudobacteriovorax antillogorgiicola]SMF43094.1 endonuclease-8 [Pseudobacteriovorax antillogorgiicola]
MPEGPEIKNAADRIAKALVGLEVEKIQFAFEHLKPYQSEIRGNIVEKVEARGKAMLIDFSSGLHLYSHNQLYGVWRISKAGNYPKTKRQLRVEIRNQTRSALLYSASDIEVLQSHELAKHPFLSKLGPDVLSSETDWKTVKTRLESTSFRRRRLSTLLLDQQFLCGLGNYLRSEILFLSRLHPNSRPVDLCNYQLEVLASTILETSRQAYEQKGITNDLLRVEQLKADGLKRWQYRHHVFSRTGQPCYECGCLIRKESFNNRRCYLCPQCQSPG